MPLLPAPSVFAAINPCSAEGFANTYVKVKSANEKETAFAFDGYLLDRASIHSFVESCPGSNWDADKLIQNLSEQDAYIKKSLSYVSEIRTTIPADTTGFSSEEVISGREAVSYYTKKYIEEALNSSKLD